MTRAIFSSGKVRAVIRSKWRTLLKGATKEAEVLVLVRSFMGSWTSDEIAALPRELWPGRVVTPRDVFDAALRLAIAHADFAGDARSLALLQELLLFMTQAAVRIKFLGHVATTSGNAARQVATEPDERIGGAIPSAANDVRVDGPHE